jgi:hypothetical protein
MIHNPDQPWGTPCGIVALAAITGRPCAALEAECRANGSLKGVGMKILDFEAQLKRHGFIMGSRVPGTIRVRRRGIMRHQQLTLGRFIRDHFESESLYVLMMHRHIGVFHGTQYVDGSIIPADCYPWHSREHIHSFYEVTSLQGGQKP